MFWNELGNLLKSIINTFALNITISKTHACLKYIRRKDHFYKIQ